jgi:RNA polymerase sigma-70 factor (ECF subfamily)
MVESGQTDMGGSVQAFQTTHWSLIAGIQAHDSEERALTGLMLERYWKPIYCYLRRKGYGNEEAKDLTQGFFQQVVLHRNLVQRADETRGRFRTFLLHALNQYVINENVKQTRHKRIPKDKLVPLDSADPPAIPAAVFAAEAEQSYHYAWTSALMDRVLMTVRLACYDEGLETHWHIFSERVVRPILDDAAPPSLGTLSAKYGIADPRQASNMIVTVKRRFRSTLREHIRMTVLTNDQVDDELREILRFLPEMAQYSSSLRDYRTGESVQRTTRP